VWSTIVSGLRARTRRLAGTSVAVLIGVAFLAATLVLGDTMRAGFGGIIETGNAGVDVAVRNRTVIGADEDQARGLLDRSLVDVVAAVPGVAAVAPVVEGVGQIVGADGDALGGGGPPTVAANWIDDPELNPYSIVQGRPPAADDEVVIDGGSAREGGLAVGDRTIVRTPHPTEVRVVGIAGFGRGDSEGAITFVAFTEAAARELLLDGRDQLTSIVARGLPGAAEGELRDAVAAALPAGVEALTGDQLTAEEREALEGDFLGFVRVFLLAFAGVAMLVATFSIHNTFTILVAQRTRESALLRAIGASRRQILASVAVEALLVGVTASVVGAGAGLGVATALKSLLESFGMEMDIDGVVVTGGALAVAIATGILVTLVASAVPAVKAARVAPMAALRESAIDGGAPSRRRAAAGAVLLAAGVLLTVLATSSADGAMARAGLGALAVVVGAVVLGPAAARPIAGVLGAPVAALRGQPGRLARRNAVRNPRRTAGTASALLVGVAVVALFATIAASIKTSIDETVARTFGGDLVIVQDGFSGAGLDPALADAVRALPEVATSAALSDAVATTTGGAVVLPTAVDPSTLPAVLDLDVREGSMGELRAGTVAVSRWYADDRGLDLGDPLPMTFADGASIAPTVAAIYGVRDIVGDVTMALEDWVPHAPQRSDVAVLIGLAPGVGLEAGEAAVQRVAERFAAPDVQDREEYVDSVAAQIDAMLTLVYGLLGLAVLIALMGIANTLSLSIHERTRELGLLRAIGQTRGQLRATVRWESVIVALFGTVGGLGLGTFLGWGLVRAVSEQEGFGTFTVPFGSLAAIAALAAVAGVVAAVRPARRAARLDVLDAIATS